MARYAAEAGWALDVVTRDPDTLSLRDAAALAQLPPGVRVFGVGARTPLWDRAADAVWRLIRRARPRPPAQATGNGATPGVEAEGSVGLVPVTELRWRLSLSDLRRAYHAWRLFARDGAWARAALAVAGRLTGGTRYAAIVTCGPPHMVHLAGARLSERTGLPFVMDLRDPWGCSTAVSRLFASPVWPALARRYERRSVRRAALVVTNTALLRAAMARAHGEGSAEFLTVMNGYDDDPLPPPRPADRFVIAYAGSIYIDRNPQGVFRAASRVVRELGLSPAQFGFEFIGHLGSDGGASLLAAARAEGLDGFVQVGPPRPRREALDFMARATVLLSLPQGVPLAIPSKIFEYMRYQAWLLVLSRPESAVAELLEDTTADVVDPDDVDGIARALRSHYQSFAAGARPPRLADDERFSRRAQAQVLFEALRGVTGPGAQP